MTGQRPPGRGLEAGWAQCRLEIQLPQACYTCTSQAGSQELARWPSDRGQVVYGPSFLHHTCWGDSERWGDKFGKRTKQCSYGRVASLREPCQ